MRLLFVGPGFPGIRFADGGSGIGTYLREITLGLTEAGHECHVLVWSSDNLQHSEVLDSVTVHAMPRSHWPVIERLSPDSRNVFKRARVVKALDRKYSYDWIEIQSDEGIDIGIQRSFPSKAILRVHTTLAQMCEHKQVTVTARTKAYLARERASFRLASRVLTHSHFHAKELAREFPFLSEPQVVLHGYGRNVTEGIRDLHQQTATPRFLIVGTLDRRKGTDRLPAIAASISRLIGECEFRFVSSSPKSALAAFGMGSESVHGVTVTYRTKLSSAELRTEYLGASALLHVARYESFGLPLIEAASAGVPVVATATGCAPALLGGSLADLLVEGDSPEQCAQAMLEACRKRQEYGQEMIKSYSRQFTRQRMVTEYLHLLRDWRVKIASAALELK